METNPPRKNWVLRWATIIGIVVILNLFFSVAIAVVYPEPEFNDFCEQTQVRPTIQNEQQCLDAGGQWTATPKLESETATGYCDQFFTCSKEYQDARESYQQNVFITLVILGILSLVAGVFSQSYHVVSIGLSYGGVLSLIIASIRYWSSAPDIVRLILVGAALAVLLFIAARKFRE